MSDKNILQEADDLTSNDRAKAYGPAKPGFQCTADFWATYLSRKYKIEISLDHRDVAMMMVLLKISRDAHTPKRDNLVDGAGYFRTAEMCDEVEVENFAFLKHSKKCAVVDRSPDCVCDCRGFDGVKIDKMWGDHK